MEIEIKKYPNIEINDTQIEWYYKEYIEREITKEYKDTNCLILLCNGHDFIVDTEKIYKNKVSDYIRPVITIVHNLGNCESIDDIKKYYRYFDSSIWNYILFISPKVPEGTKDNDLADNLFFEITELGCKLNKCLEIIKKNYDNKLYELTVTNEFIGFNYRLLKNSYLEDFSGSGHANYIVPFKFHLESHMKILALAEYEKLMEKANRMELGWNVLLLDDYSQKKLIKVNGDECDKNKYDILEELLKSLHEEYCIKYTKDVKRKSLKKLNIKITVSDSIEDTFEKIKTKTYDVILLDYLLGKIGDTNKRESGVDFIKKINKPDIIKDEEEKELVEKIIKGKGPLGKFYIFPISVFSFALMDELSEEGISFYSDRWILDSGADMINTPNLFAYQLFKFMNMQIDEINNCIKNVFDNFNILNLEKVHDSEIINDSKSMDDIYKDFILFQDLLSKLNDDYKRMKSTLAKSILDYYKYNSYIWEHIHNVLDIFKTGPDTYRNELLSEVDIIKYLYISYFDEGKPQHIKDDNNINKSIKLFINKLYEYINNKYFNSKSIIEEIND